jgi:hypothetical protein
VHQRRLRVRRGLVGRVVHRLRLAPRERERRHEGHQQQAPAQHAWRTTNPWHRPYTDLAARGGKNPAKSAVARKILIAAWHVLSRNEPFKPAARRGPGSVSASSRCFLAA